MSDKIPYFLTIGDHKVAIGLSWKASPSGQLSSKEVSILSKAAGLNFGAIMKNESIVGFCSSESKGLPSGAAWLASGTQESNFVLIEEIPDDPSISWLCIIRQNTPVLDIVCKNTEINAYIEEWVVSGKPNVFTRVFFYEGARTASFLDLVGNSKPQYFVKQVTGIDPKLAIGLGALLVVGTVGFIGNHLYSEYKKEKARKDQMQAASMKDEQLRLEIERVKRDNQLKIEGALKTNYVEDASLKDRINAWMDSVGEFPLHVAGWVPKRAECNKKECTFFYGREISGTVNSFLESAEKNRWTVSKWTPEECSLILNLSSSNRRANISNIREKDPFLKDFISNMQKMAVAGLKFDVRESSNLKIEIEAYPDGSFDPINWEEGEFMVSGSSLAEPRGVSEYIGYDNLTAEAFTVNFDTLAWSIKGKYVVKK